MVYNLIGIKEKRAHKKNENLEFKIFVRLNSTHFYYDEMVNISMIN